MQQPPIHFTTFIIYVWYRLLVLLGGFYPVYFTSLGLIFIGMFYLWLIPESVQKEIKKSDSNNNKEDEENQTRNVASKVWRSFNQTNRLFCETLRYVFR